MGLKRQTPEGSDRPEIMYVCDLCAEFAPEGCGHTDPADIRRAPDGKWLCEGCWDNDPNRDENSPDFNQLPVAPVAFA